MKLWISLMMMVVWATPTAAWDGIYEAVEEPNPFQEFLELQPDISVREHGRELFRLEDDSGPFDQFIGRSKYRIIDCSRSWEC